MSELIAFVIKRQDKILELLGQHLEMVFIALSISIVLGMMIGYLITYNKKAAQVVLLHCGYLYDGA